MDDLISRQEAIDAIKRCESSWSYGINTGLIKAMNAVADVPTIDPVKHGWWYITEDMPYFGHTQEYLTCSACEGRLHGTGVEEWDYCPNCGARMDLKNETD